MNKQERDREKELKRLIYIQNELIKEAKKRKKVYCLELKELGNNGAKNDRRVRKES